MIRLVPMPDKDFEPFMKISMHDQAEGQVKAGIWLAEEAEANIQNLRSQFLPDGLTTSNHYFFSIEETGTGEIVGGLWYMLAEDDGKHQLFVLDIQIDEDHRRYGFGTQAFKAMEEKAREMGIRTIALHVFEDNHPARAMYEKLGYAGTRTAMSKEIDL